MIVTDTPDRWVIVKLPNAYKVFATWHGSYSEGESWKLNSGITKVKKEGDYYYFLGWSGSVYECHKNGYGTTFFGEGVLERIKEQGGEVMKEEDILNFKWIKDD